MALADKKMKDARAGYSPSALDGATESFSGWEPKKLWRARDGRSEECAWTEGFDTRADGRSLVATDFDDDGDVDLLMLNRNAPRLQFFRNDGESGHSIRLRFDEPNVKVNGDEVLLQRGFASSVPPELIRGLGEETSADLEVTWHDGTKQRFTVKEGTTTFTNRKPSFTPFKPRVTPKPPPFPSTLESLGLKSGERTLVTIFLAGCEPCRKEAPVLNALQKKYEVIGLGVATDDVEAARIAKSLGFSFTAKALPETAADALSTNGRLEFPTTLVFAADGTLERVVTDVNTLR
ncbi:MAG: ASPIC/UnbV domain-containing protein [Archangium sp.]